MNHEERVVLEGEVERGGLLKKNIYVRFSPLKKKTSRNGSSKDKIIKFC